MKTEKSITRTTGDFIADGFKPGMVLRGSFFPGRFIVTEVKSTEIVIRGSGFWESVKYHFRRFMAWVREVRGDVVSIYNKAKRNMR